MAKKSPLETREKLLRTTAEFIAQNGASNLTLDTIAAASGVSKGGLLHHFPTKHALMQGLMAQIAQVFVTRLEQALTTEPEGTPGRWTRAYVTASFEYDPDELQLTTAIASVVTNEPALVAVLQQQFAWIDERIENDGLPAARTTAIRLACDGLWIAELLELSTVNEPLRSGLRDELIRLTRHEVNP
ncbi:MAG: TetR/AcrR family transcriptional regulator [Pleurocapsa sp. SU_196_0]|nr:TetR/AcrR family transcriptional regulator [Pleurocapsa sp. SU_196_0]